MVDLNEIIGGFEAIQSELVMALPARRRLWSPEPPLASLRGVLLLGARGVGKTTQLLAASHARKTLYISVDNPLATSASLTELAQAALGKGYEGLIFDEVHMAPNWSRHLKTLYDANPRKFFWASDSSSLVLREGTADVSRRFPQITVPLLSFREFLSLRGVDVVPPWPFLRPDFHAVRQQLQRPVLAAFTEHISGGMRPFFLEGAYGARVLATLEKSLFHDIPFFVPRVTETHLRLMNAVVAHLARSVVPTVNMEALCRDWAVGRQKLYELLAVLEHAGVLTIVRFSKDKSVLSKGAKMFLADPSLYSVLGGQAANQREAYVVSMARASRCAVFAAADETQGDFEIEGELVEVGGPSKKRKKAAKVIRADVEVPTETIVPLWCLGFSH